MNVKDLDAPEITAEEKLAFDTAYDNITKFHRAQVKEGISVETMPGVKCRREVRAI
jgi:histidinol dehydrogenase